MYFTQSQQIYKRELAYHKSRKFNQPTKKFGKTFKKKEKYPYVCVGTLVQNMVTKQFFVVEQTIRKRHIMT